MRYYDMVETPKTQKVFVDEGINRIAETDERVFPWFASLPVGYIRSFDADGLPFNELIPPPTDEELLAQAELHFMSMTDAHIQAEVEKYNEANGVKFASIHNCVTYKDVVSYPHQTFCQNIIQWNADIWEAVRAYQTTLTAIPTDVEWQAILDGVVFA